MGFRFAATGSMQLNLLAHGTVATSYFYATATTAAKRAQWQHIHLSPPVL